MKHFQFDTKSHRVARVAVIGTVGVPARYGGFETLAEQLARHISTQKMRLVLYCQRSAYPELRGQPDTHFEGHQRVFVPLRANGPASMLHDVVAMLHAALMARVDVMLVLGYSGAWALPLMRLLRPRMRIVTNIDGMEWRRDKFGAWTKKVLRWLEGCAVRFSHRIIADNAALIPLAKASYPDLAALLIAYGGDHTLVQPATTVSKSVQPYYFSVARIEPENNCELILQAFAEVPEQYLVFVGNWNASDYGRSLKARYAGRPNLHLLDPVYDLAVLAALRAGSCGYVHGHSVGGTNPSLIEALFHTNRIFAFECEFNRSSLDDHGDYFANPSQLMKLLRDSMNHDISSDALQLLRRRYRWSTIVNSYIDAFNDESGY